jgi:hypothetical protein
MATYLPGVEPFIPDYQPFQPDFNFYGNVLQTKQNQYDTNWKNLNDIYGQYFYADVLRPSDIEKKDNLLKKIDFELKRVSGLDLSLQQNLNQATQVFRPFYEDKTLMHDMAYTKNFKNKRASANNLKNGNDDQQAMWWQEGIEFMDIMKDRFVKSSDEESLTMWAPEYTPHIKVNEHYFALAKELGVEADKVIPGPQWMVRKRNGDLIYEPLVNIFKNEYSNNRGLQEMYRVQSVVNRERSINKAMQAEGVDRVTAETQYLTTQNKIVQEYIKRMAGSANKDVRNKSNMVKNAEDQKAVGNGNTYTNKFIKDAKDSEAIAKSVWAQVLKVKDSINTKPSKSAVTTQGDLNLNNDQLANKIDSGTAMMYAMQDIYSAAYGYSKVDELVDYEANPFAVVNARKQAKLEEIAAKESADKRVAMTDFGLKTGYLVVDDWQKGTTKIAERYRKGTKVDDTDFTTDVKDASGALYNSIRNNREEEQRAFDMTGKPGIEALKEFLGKQADAGISKGVIDAMFLNPEFDMQSTVSTIDQKAVDQYKQSKAAGGIGGPLSPEVSAAMDVITEERADRNYVNQLFENNKNYTFKDLNNLYTNAMKLASQQKGDGGSADAFLQKMSDGKLATYVKLVEGKEKIKSENKKVLIKNLASSNFLDQLATSMGMNTREEKELIASSFLDEDNGISKYFDEKVKEIFIGDKENELQINGGVYKTHKLKAYDTRYIRKGPEVGAAGSSTRALDYRNFTKHDNHNIDQMFNSEKDAFAADFQQKTGRQPDKADYSNFKNRLKANYANNLNKMVLVNKGSSPAIQSLKKDFAKVYQEAAQSKQLKTYIPAVMEKANAIGVNDIIGHYANLAFGDGKGVDLLVDATQSIERMSFNPLDMNQNRPGSEYGLVILGESPTRTGLLESTDGKSFFGDELNMDSHKNNVDKAKTIMSDLNGLIGMGWKGNKEGPEGLDVSIGAITRNVFGNPNLAAVQVGDIPYEWLEDKYVKGTDGNAGFLTRDEVRKISLNGITFVKPINQFSGLEIIQEASLDPIEMIMSAEGFVSYVDPYNAGTFTLTQSPNPKSTPHQISGYVQYIDDNGEWQTSDLGNMMPDQKYNMVNIYQQLINTLNAINQKNNIQLKNLEKKGIEVSTPPTIPTK